MTSLRWSTCQAFQTLSVFFSASSPPCRSNHGAYAIISRNGGMDCSPPATTAAALAGRRRSQSLPSLTQPVVWFLFCFGVPQCTPRLTHPTASSFGSYGSGPEQTEPRRPQAEPLGRLAAFSLPSKHDRNALIQEQERGSAPRLRSCRSDEIETKRSEQMDKVRSFGAQRTLRVGWKVEYK